MFTFLLVLEAIVAAILVTVILMQRSEGGGLGVGGSSSGLMTARGQADFLTRATAILAIAFVGLSILLAGLATGHRSVSTIDPTLARPQTGAPAAPAPAPGQSPAGGGDFLGTLGGDQPSGAAPSAAPAEAPAATSAPAPTVRQQQAPAQQQSRPAAQTPAPTPAQNQSAPALPPPSVTPPAQTPAPQPQAAGNEQ